MNVPPLTLPPKPGTVLLLMAKPMSMLLLGISLAVYPVWQVMQAIKLVFAWVMWAPGLVAVAPVAGLAIPVGPPRVVVVGG